jgi:dihydrofolate synthase/folylpolyglutamate synthase
MNRLKSLWSEMIRRTDYEKCERPRAARFSLEPMEQLCARLGNPQFAVPVLHVAGSKGKGSTCGFLELGLRHAGLRTGLYSSPHLSDWRERVRLNGALASDDAYADAFEAVLTAAGEGQTFFDLMTAAAFCIFRDAAIDVAVVEVGLGGRADSTNVVAPLAAILTSIELEHTEVLGETLTAIAGEKCGIFKRDAALHVAAGVGAEAYAVAEQTARALGTTLQSRLAAEAGESWPHPLPTMRANLALVEEVLSTLPDPRMRAGAAALRSLPAADLSLPGRFELRHDSAGRPVRFDIAHTPASLRPVLQAFRAEFADRRRGVVLALRDDKDAAALAAALGPAEAGEQWFVAPAGDHPRSADPTTIAPCFGAQPLSAPELPSGPQALLVTGSTYLVGALRPLTRA